MYVRLSGTSKATPHVAGCAALIRSRNSALTPDQVEALLKSTAIDLGANGRDDSFGSGWLNCGAAVAAS